MDPLADLAAIVGPSDVFAPDEAETYLTDHRRRFTGTAVAAVRPRNIDAVVEIVKWAARNRVPLHSQGGNTSLSGGATPTTPAVVVLSAGMNRISHVSRDGMWLEAEAGVTIEELQTAAAAAGLSFAPDWGARGSATIGGAVATNAGGLNVLWAGPMRHHVLGLRAVLADGRVLDNRRALRKDVSGVDLTQILIGSEGTLAIVTDVVVALGPPTEPQQLGLVALGAIDDLNHVAAAARQNFGRSLSALELMNDVGIAAVSSRSGRPHPMAAATEWYVLVGVNDGQGPERLAEFVDRQVRSGTVTDGIVAGTPTQQRELWHLRDEHSPTGLLDRYDEAIKLDVAVPLDRVTELIVASSNIIERYAPAATAYAFGHIGDGNIHLYALPVGDCDFGSVKPELTTALYDLVSKLGGTLSAEHGVGQLLRDDIAARTDPVELELRAAVKQLFDPHGLLNPGIGPV